MSTQFFERQDKARTNTIRLVSLFVLAVVALVVTNALLAYFAGQYVADGARANGRDDGISPSVVAVLVGLGTAAVIALGTLYQITVLRWGGGSSVAESLGGRQILGETRDLNERKLLNIVEEMAIASGTPVPPVFIMEEPAINAFAAGYLPGDAVIGVTRGAVENLNREELQGVIAHEFSHVLNGDMRMNIRMIGILHGILLIGLIGQMIVRSMRYAQFSSSSSKDKNGGAAIILVIGVVLIVVGSVGTFIGGLIKAAVSRQREYLADASAVQFTRNAGGLAGALKRIAAIATHGQLQHPNASVASHMYFAQGVYEGFTGLLATHPPLQQRILALDPNWDGNLPILRANNGSLGQYATANASNSQSSNSSMHEGLTSNFAGSGSPRPAVQLQPETASVPVPTVMAAADQIGAPEQAHRQYVAALLRHMDPVLIEASRDPYSARALVMALLVSDEPKFQEIQFRELESTLKGDVVELTHKLVEHTVNLPEAARLPLVDLALPMLRRMSAPQYSEFANAFAKMCKADSKLTIFEWTLAQVLTRNLRKQYVPQESTATRYFRLNGLQDELSLLFSVLAKVGNEQGDALKAFNAAAIRFAPIELRMIDTNTESLQQLDKVLQKLSLAHPRRRKDIVDACAAIVCSDRLVRIREAELLRGISDLLDCPMPPLVGRMEETP